MKVEYKYMEKFYTKKYKRNIIKSIIYIILSSILTMFCIIYPSTLTVPDVYGDNYKEIYAQVTNSEKKAIKVVNWNKVKQKGSIAIVIGYNLTFEYDVEGILYKNTAFATKDVNEVKIYYNMLKPEDIKFEYDLQGRGFIIFTSAAVIFNIGFILRLLDMLFLHKENYL